MFVIYKGDEICIPFNVDDEDPLVGVSIPVRMGQKIKNVSALDVEYDLFK